MRAAEVAGLFSAGPMIGEVVGAEIGQASALKMCFAAYNKGRAALLASVLASVSRYSRGSHQQRHTAMLGITSSNRA